MRLGGGGVFERDEAERRVLPQAGGKSVLSAKYVVWLRVDRGSQFREQKKKKDLPLSFCLSGWRESLDGVISSTMGCSLCTLQKPEEQYKLLYEVCQVLCPSLF